MKTKAETKYAEEITAHIMSELSFHIDDMTDAENEKIQIGIMKILLLHIHEPDERLEQKIEKIREIIDL